MQSNGTGPVHTKGIRPAVWGTLLVMAGLAVLGTVAFSWLAAKPTRSAEPQTAADEPAFVSAAAVQETVSNAPVASPAPAVAAEQEIVPSQPPDVDALIRTLKDGTESPEARINAARRLAGVGSNEALAALKEVLLTGPDELRAAIAEALGNCPHPECPFILLGLLADRSEAVVRAAVRGLARQDSIQALDALNRLLHDSTKALSVRCEAAAGLASMRQPAAMEALSRAAMLNNDEAILSQLLDGVADHPIGESRDFFQNYLRSPHVSTDLKVTALEALGQTPGEVGSFLADYLRNPDPELRAAAAWALSTADDPGSLASQLMPLLQSESDPEVRRRLYQALGNQENVDWQTILPALQRETDAIARLAGLELLAGLLRNDILQNRSSEQQLAYFDQTVVPELKTAALSGRSSEIRKQAIIALKRAGTPAALEAVQHVNQHAGDQIAPGTSGHSPKQSK